MNGSLYVECQEDWSRGLFLSGIVCVLLSSFSLVMMGMIGWLGFRLCTRGTVGITKRIEGGL